MNDDRIDEAARALTEGAPGADLGARVVARIEQKRSRRVPTRAWALATTVAAALVVAAVVYRSQPTPSNALEGAPVDAALPTSKPAPQIEAQAQPLVSEIDPAMSVIPPIEVGELPGTNPIVVDELSVEPILMTEIDLQASDTVNR